MQKALLLLLAAVLLAGCVSQAPSATPVPDSIPEPQATSAPTARPPVIQAPDTPTPAPFTGSCVESDGGNNPTAKGTVRTVTEDGEKSFDDTCLGGTRLLEYYCGGTEAKNEQIDCEFGCRDGACNEALPAAKFNFSGGPKNPFISPCETTTVTLNVRNGPALGDVRFFASWEGKLGGSFNPEAAQLTRDGFAETKVTASANGCYTRGNAVANFTAQVCGSGGCFNKTVFINYTAGKCLNVEGCDANQSIAG